VGGWVDDERRHPERHGVSGSVHLLQLLLLFGHVVLLLGCPIVLLAAGGSCKKAPLARGVAAWVVVAASTPLHAHPVRH
jgi:hypothetical protein